MAGRFSYSIDQKTTLVNLKITSHEWFIVLYISYANIMLTDLLFEMMGEYVKKLPTQSFSFQKLTDNNHLVFYIYMQVVFSAIKIQSRGRRALWLVWLSFNFNCYYQPKASQSDQILKLIVWNEEMKISTSTRISGLTILSEK